VDVISERALKEKIMAIMKPQILVGFILLFSLFTISPSLYANNSIELPSIGDISVTTISEEQRIGSAWLKQYRRQVPTSADLIIIDYLEKLLESLASHSDVDYPSLSLVVAKNPSLNAFAVPGGVIGIHTGLFNYAKTEQQLASVLSHELAHLSQRHYARGVDKQKSQSLTTMATLLASLILVATTDGDAGIAALSASQAYAIDQQLRFSRSFEREADRIGMDILVKAGMDPHATEAMFTQMERLTRFSSKPPEFLLTHPLTTNRIIDAINLARQYPKREVTENINYQLVRARALLDTEESPQQAIIRFRRELSGFDTSIDGSRYGLAVALNDDEKFDEAEKNLQILLEKYPDNLILRITQSDILAGKGQAEAAIMSIKALLKQHPSYFPLAMQLSQLYRRQQNYTDAKNVLIQMSEQRKQDPAIWYELAEVAGLNNDTSQLHKARAEYFILHANFDNAEQQLQALLTREGLINKQSLFYLYAQQRIENLDKLRKSAKL
jgi:predicted Zn-dependent protease